MTPGVAISGPGRSGTSVVARALQICGMYLGKPEELMPGAAGNPDGYWEHLGAVSLNDAILDHFDAGWDLPPVDPRWDDPALGTYRAQGLSLIRQLAEHARWGWKDPRTSFTLPFWQQLVPALRSVLCLRHPNEVAASLRRIHGTSHAFGRKWWMDCASRTVANAGKDRLLVIDFDALIQAPDRQFRRLCDFCELTPDGETLAAAVALIRPDRPGQYHAPALPAQFEPLYRYLQELARKPLT